ncbi:glycerophosphodiester phosphodiesterase family protein [Caenimonas aquaedulcis]|uniref:Glycerophosphodiester phosphodiesterase n=1 Tax=Caenimonas aquaedulcis TaxID=2793270 RepID=A0A931H8W4_9BURK|nr:glycerophosphodiester phosphodiesterase family protein [Caenimonas aquaedulcis]MBG9390547.1 glycerophosphodiester phosphodiesterase [Caenimonas aquaedulcis]
MIIVGHRGARNLWPENSLSGFRELAALGVEAVEFDVHETRDGTAVVIHDPLMDRTTEGSGAIRDLPAAQVLATPLRAGQGERGGPAGECVPSLDDVLALFRPTGMELHVEIKTNAAGELPPGAIARLVKKLHGAGVADRSILTCFVPEVLEQVLQEWPQGRVLASLDHRSAEMLGGITKALARYAAIPGCIVAVQKTLLAATWDACSNALGSERLGAWVLNEPDEIAQWIGMPIRQITTDRPDLALAARRKA